MKTLESEEDFNYKKSNEGDKIYKSTALILYSYIPQFSEYVFDWVFYNKGMQKTPFSVLIYNVNEKLHF